MTFLTPSSAYLKRFICSLICARFQVLIEMSGEPAMLDEPAYQAFQHELQLMEACSTTSGYYNETQLLADLR